VLSRAIAVAALAALACGACRDRRPVERLTAAETEKLADLLADAPAIVQNDAALWRAHTSLDQLFAIRAAGGDAAAPCTAHPHDSIDVAAGDTVPDSPQLTAATTGLVELARRVAVGEAAPGDLDEVQRLLDLGPVAIIVHATNPGSAGIPVSSMFVYDFESARVVCAGAVGALHAVK
jgi:hypothetical protein